MQAVCVVDRRYHQLALELLVGQILPRARRRPAVLLEHLLVVGEAGDDEADADRLVGSHPGDVVDVGQHRRVLDRRAEPEGHRLVHRAVVEEHHVELLRALLRLQLGERVGGVAGDVDDLDIVLRLERRNDLLLHQVFGGTAVGAHVHGRGIRDRGSRRRHRRGHRGACHQSCFSHLVPPSPSRHRSPAPFTWQACCVWLRRISTKA